MKKKAEKSLSLRRRIKKLPRTIADRIRIAVGTQLSKTQPVRSPSRHVRAMAFRAANFAGKNFALPPEWTPHDDDIASYSSRTRQLLFLLVRHGRNDHARSVLSKLRKDPKSQLRLNRDLRDLSRLSATHAADRYGLTNFGELAQKTLTRTAKTQAVDRFLSDLLDLPARLASCVIRLDEIAAQVLSSNGRNQRLRRLALAEYFNGIGAAASSDPKEDALHLLEYFEKNLRSAAQPSALDRNVLRGLYHQARQQFLQASMSGATDNSKGQSPLTPEGAAAFMNDIDARLKAWRQSSGYQRVRADEEDRRIERQRVRSTLSGITTRKLRVLAVSDNFNFFAPALGPFEGQGLDVRTFAFEQLRQEKGGAYLAVDQYLPAALLPSGPDKRSELAAREPLLSELLDWCDVVFAEWCNAPALWLSRFLDERKTLVIRLHSYEAFSPWPFSVNWGGVDGVIFVAEPIRRFVNAQHGERLKGIEQLVLPNICYSRARMVQEKPARRYTLGMAGYANANKNPILALEILKVLRATDARWTLRLIGTPFSDAEDVPERERAYRDRLRQQVAAVADAVHFEPFASDLDPWYDEIGFILSCSDREGTHETIREAMAAGCIPVIRDWPMTKTFGGALSVYPDHASNIYASAEEAAAIILREQERYTDAVNASHAYFAENFDPDRVAARYAQFLHQVAR